MENRTGALGNIGAIAVARSVPDGYTLHFAAQSVAVNVTLAPVADFDPIKDFEPVMLVATAQDLLIVPPNSPFKAVGDLIAYAKRNPRKLTYGTLGTSSSGNMAVAVFSELNERIQMRQVPLFPDFPARHGRHLRTCRCLLPYDWRTHRQRRLRPRPRPRRIGSDACQTAS